MDLLEKLEAKRESEKAKVERCRAKALLLTEAAERRAAKVERLDWAIGLFSGRRRPSTLREMQEAIDYARAVVPDDIEAPSAQLDDESVTDANGDTEREIRPENGESKGGKVSGMAIIDAAQAILSQNEGDEYRHYFDVAQIAVSEGYRNANPHADLDTVARSFLDVMRRAPHLFDRWDRWFFRPVTSNRTALDAEKIDLDPDSRLGFVERLIRDAGHPLKTRFIAEKLIEAKLSNQENIKYLMNSIYNSLERCPKFVKGERGFWRLVGMPDSEGVVAGADDKEQPKDTQDNSRRDRKPSRKRSMRVGLLIRLLREQPGGLSIAEMREPIRAMGYGVNMKNNVLYSSLNMAILSAPYLFAKDTAGRWKLSPEYWAQFGIPRT